MKLDLLLPSIPDYYKAHIDNSIDLNKTTSICCPFHKENTPSFSYSIHKKMWTCFGKCKTGGDVIRMHQLNYKLGSREESLRSLKVLYNIKDENLIEDLEALANAAKYVVTDNESTQVEFLVRKAIRKANNVNRWVDLDLIMSYTPIERFQLEELLISWGEKIEIDIID